METIIELIKALSTPILVILAILIFRKDLKRLKLPGVAEIDFKVEKRGMHSTPALERIRKNLSASWENTGNIYWLGHDLMWTMQIALRNARKDHIMYGLKQSLHHLRSIDLGDKSPEKRLEKLLDHIDSTLESKLDNEMRLKFAKDIENILDEIGVYMEANQPDFKGFWIEPLNLDRGY